MYDDFLRPAGCVDSFFFLGLSNTTKDYREGVKDIQYEKYTEKTGELDDEIGPK